VLRKWINKLLSSWNVSENPFAAPAVDPSDLYERLVLSEKCYGELHRPFLDSIMKEVITEMTPKEVLITCRGEIQNSSLLWNSTMKT